MRGMQSKNRRMEASPRFPPNESTGMMVSQPAPIGGWNARDPLASMPNSDAVILDNFFPDTGSVGIRPGKISWATGMTGNARAFLPYNSATSQKLFCATSSGIYNVTAPGTVGAAVATCTNGQYNSANFTNAGGSFLVAVNGTDDLKSFDGTNWTVINGVTTPAITGVATSTFSNVTLHKHRLWFIQKNSMTMYYLDTDAFAGVAHPFPMGGIFKRGGYIVAATTWTVDGGGGMVSNFLIVTSEGELAIYDGTDPSSALSWDLQGVYYVGQPIGTKCFASYGGDVVYLSQFGLIPISKYLLSIGHWVGNTLDAAVTVSFKINGAVNTATQAFGSVYGWQIELFPNHNALILNVPQAVDGVTYQYVMNTLTRSWCSFSGWNANCVVVFQNNLYTASGTTVWKNWVGTSDAGTPITATCQQSYSKMGYGYQKQVSLTRPNISVDSASTVSLAFDSDFLVFNGAQSLTTYSPLAGGAVWDSALWDTAIWAAGLSPISASWTSVPNIPGYLLSFRLQLTTSSSRFSWTSTDHVIKRAGVL